MVLCGLIFQDVCLLDLLEYTLYMGKMFIFQIETITCMCKSIDHENCMSIYYSIKVSSSLLNHIDVTSQHSPTLQTKANLYHYYRLIMRFKFVFKSNTLPEALIRTLERISIII